MLFTENEDSYPCPRSVLWNEEIRNKYQKDQNDFLKGVWLMVL